MLIQFFRLNFPTQYITIGVIGLFLWGLGAMHPPTMPPPDGFVPLYGLLFDWLSGFPYLAMGFGFLLVMFQALWLNYIVAEHNLVPHNTTLCALLFLLFTSLLPSYLTLTPINIATLFILFILKAILEAYNQNEPIEVMYTAGFFVALSSFFYLPSLFFYGFLLLCFLVYRSMKWREWVSSLVGLVTPFLYLVLVYFLTNRLPALITLYSDFFGQVHVFVPETGWNTWVLFGYFGLFAFLGLWDTIHYIGYKTVEIRKKSIILLWILFWLLLTLLYANSLQLYFPVLLSMSLSVFITNFYMRLRKLFWFELLLWLLLIMIFTNTLFWSCFPEV